MAAYYYNRAAQWGKEVSLTTKHDAYLYGTIKDCERQNRAPKELTTYYWQVDDPIGHKFGYVEGLQIQKSSQVIRKLVENISKNGNLCLNISPKSDGTIPDDQQNVLREVGSWLKINGEAVYDTRAWLQFGEGNWRFTQKGAKTLYAFMIRWKGGDANIKVFSTTILGKVKSVKMLGYDNDIKFMQSSDGLLMNLPEKNPHADIAVMKIEIL